MTAGSAVKIRLPDGRGVADLKYLSEDVDRHGNVRVYVRPPGQKKTRLREPLGSEAFFEEYRRALSGEPMVAAPTLNPSAAAGTLRWICERYFESGDFLTLNSRTQRVRRSILDTICQSTLRDGRTMRGALPVEPMLPRHVAEIRDERTDAIEAANARVKALRQVFAWAVENDFMPRNPARDVRYLQSGSEGYHTWTVAEVKQYVERHPLGTKAHLALALLLFTGARRSDVVKLGRQMEQNGWLHFTEKKRGHGKKPKQRAVPILPILRTVIDATPSGHLTYLVTSFGKPFSENGFGNWMRKRCDEAGLPHCSAHGLRKAGATIAANRGATEHQLMSMFGWESPKQAAIYTRRANRIRLAGQAMHLLVFDEDEELEATALADLPDEENEN